MMSVNILNTTRPDSHVEYCQEDEVYSRETDVVGCSEGAAGKHVFGDKLSQ